MTSLSGRGEETVKGRPASNPAVPPRPESDEPCECPPGWQHEPDCPHVTGKADE